MTLPDYTIAGTTFAPTIYLDHADRDPARTLPVPSAPAVDVVR